jgi:uncharacterized protein YfiM (DUF2279 family)
MLPFTTRKVYLNVALLVVLNFFSAFSVLAQDTSLMLGIDTLQTEVPNKKRIRLVAAGNIIGYGGSMIALNAAWYSQYKKTNFHSFNDNDEWLQVDKVGHMHSAYLESRYSTEMWRWTGMKRKHRIWIGGLSGAAYQTVIEVLDGFSEGWGWSWGDFAANVAGSGVFIAQELAWDQQRIKLKFSFNKRDYGDKVLNARANDLYGNSLTERALKDYNTQTYWMSANISSFFPQSKTPRWLSVAVGYGGEGMFGARRNTWTDKNTSITYDRTDVKRYRQWYLAPDIDLTRLKTKKKAVRIALGILDMFKFPTPSLELSNGSFKWNWLHF